MNTATHNRPASAKPKLTVLFVDDEPYIIQGLGRLLRNYRSEWDMLFVESGKEALKIFSEQHIDVIVADMRMPEMNGAELLTQIMKIYPDTVRLVLSGHSDRESSLKAANCAHQFLSKPCDAKLIKSVIDRSCALRDVLKSESLRKAITGIKTLPSLPRLYTRLTDALRDAETALKAVGDIIIQDISMSAKVLQLVNSAFFALPNRVTDLYQGVSYLGLDAIKALVISRDVFYAYKNKGHKYADVLEEISNHSMLVAKAARVIAESIAPKDKRLQEDSFVAGLLHDIGKIVVVQESELYDQVCELIKEHNLPETSAEKRVFGASHAVIGAYLLSIWGLPNNIVEAVAYHHNPMDMPVRAPDAAACVHIANALMHEREKRSLAEEFVKLDYEYLDELNLIPRLASWMSSCRGVVGEDV